MSSKDLSEALRALTERGQSADGAGPAAMKARGAAGISRVGALLGGDAATSGIASPLVETAYADRTFHANQTITRSQRSTSADGLFTLVIKPVKTIRFKDAAARDVTIEFKAPT